MAKTDKLKQALDVLIPPLPTPAEELERTIKEMETVFQSVVDNWKGRLTKFQEVAATDPARAMLWDGEEVLYATNCLRLAENAVVNGEEEKLELERFVKTQTSDLLDDSDYYPNSTNALTNLDNLAKWRAKGTVRKLAQSRLWYLDRITELERMVEAGVKETERKLNPVRLGW